MFAIGFIAGFLGYTLYCLTSGEKWDWRIALISGLASGLGMALPGMAPLLGLSGLEAAIWMVYWATLMTWWGLFAAKVISRGYGGYGSCGGYGGFWSNHYG